ncbi:MAG TPA: hypothetical protein VMM37_06555 [Bacteroidota bacterium]|nr:hypothetical protein [Bacteroidota bacterium]
MFQRLFCLALVVTVMAGPASTLPAQNYFPDTGPSAVYQRALDLGSNLRVLVLSVQPGYEDLDLIARYRFEKGADVLSAYVSNGQSGESDSVGLLPTTLASRLRTESHDATSLLGATSRFLNMPDLPAAATGHAVRLAWHADTLQWRLTVLLSDFKPDLIFVCRDFGGSPLSARISVLLGDLKHAADMLRKSLRTLPRGEQSQVRPWVVSRILIDDGSQKGFAVPTAFVHPVWKKSLAAIAQQAELKFQTIAAQRRLLRHQGKRSYKIVVNNDASSVKSLDQELVSRPLKRVKAMEESVLLLAKEAKKAALSPPDTQQRKTLIQDIARTGSLVDRQIVDLRPLNQAEARSLTSWRDQLESLRNALLGAELFARLSESVLAERQIVYLAVDSASGLDPALPADLYFPEVAQDWYVNEKTIDHVPYKAGETISLISPVSLAYDLPEALYGLQKTALDNVVRVFLVQKGLTPERNITARKDFRVKYAPRYSFEVDPPIVRAGFTPTVTLRFTNHTRDRVRDTLVVQDSVVQSDRQEFSSATKESIDTVTLHLRWRPGITEGTYVIPVVSHGKVVARFAARAFPVNVDAAKRVGFVPALVASPAAEAFNNLGLPVSTVAADKPLAPQLDSLHTLVLDRRVLTLRPELLRQRHALSEFVQKGGHLVILPQDAGVWNDSPLVDGVRLTGSSDLDLSALVRMDSTQTILRHPNRIVPEDWNNWIDRRAFNTVTLKSTKGITVPVRLGQGGNPAVFSHVSGKGTVTYVDLDLMHQWINLHPGSLRLLANILSF